MTTVIALGLIACALMVAVGVLAYRLGKNAVKLDSSERINEERERDAEIDSRTHVDRPLSRMLRK